MVEIHFRSPCKGQTTYPLPAPGHREQDNALLRREEEGKRNLQPPSHPRHPPPLPMPRCLSVLNQKGGKHFSFSYHESHGNHRHHHPESKQEYPSQSSLKRIKNIYMHLFRILTFLGSYFCNFSSEALRKSTLQTGTLGLQKICVLCLQVP